MTTRTLLLGTCAAAVLLVYSSDAVAGSSVPVDAILLLDGTPSNEQAARVVESLEGVLRPRWTLVPASGLVDVARTDPVCSTGREDPTERLLARLREGLRLFFEGLNHVFVGNQNTHDPL